MRRRRRLCVERPGGNPVFLVSERDQRDWWPPRTRDPATARATSTQSPWATHLTTSSCEASNPGSGGPSPTHAFGPVSEIALVRSAGRSSREGRTGDRGQSWTEWTGEGGISTPDGLIAHIGLRDRSISGAAARPRRGSVLARWRRDRGQAGGKHLPQPTANDRAKSGSSSPESPSSSSAATAGDPVVRICKQEVAGSIPAGSTLEVPANRYFWCGVPCSSSPELPSMEALWKPPSGTWLLVRTRSARRGPR